MYQKTTSNQSLTEGSAVMKQLLLYQQHCALLLIWNFLELDVLVFSVVRGLLYHLKFGLVLPASIIMRLDLFTTIVA